MTNETVPIYRKCPCCRVWTRMTTTVAPDVATRYRACCPNCGHIWPCRIGGADRLAHYRRLYDAASV